MNPRLKFISIFVLWFFWSVISVSQSLMDLGATLMFLLGLGLIYPFRANFFALFQEKMVRILAVNLLIWIGIVTIGLLLSPNTENRERKLIAFFEFRWVIELFIWIFILRLIQPQWRHVNWLLVVPSLSALYGIFALFTKVSPLIKQDSPERLGGFLGNPMPYAHIIGPIFALLIGVSVVVLVQRRKLPISWAVSGGLLGISLLLTMTRGVWVGIFIAILILPFVLKIKRVWYYTLGFLVMSSAVFLTVPPLKERVFQIIDPQKSYDSQRLVLWKTNIEMFKEHPLVGVGYSQNSYLLPKFFSKLGFPTDQFQGHAHSQYIQFLSGTGILGLLCFILFIGLILRISFQSYSNAKNSEFIRAISLGLFLAQIVFLVGGLTEANFSIAKDRALYLFLAAMVMALPVWEKSHERQS